MTVELTDTSVITAYKNADANGKKLIQDLIGDQVDFNQKITDRVKSFADACTVLGLNAWEMQKSTERDELAYVQLKTIVKALNEGWKPNWSNSKEYKWYPWWDLSSGFSLYFVNYDYTDSAVSSRLCFKSRELAEYAAKQFKEIYRDYMLVV